MQCNGAMHAAAQLVISCGHSEQFWHEVQESNEWLQYQLTKLPQLFSPKQTINGTSHQIRKTMDEMMKILKDYLQVSL